MFWPVGDFHDNTTRLLGKNISGFLTQVEAEAVIDDILSQQLKPHHVSYRVAEYTSFSQLCESGVLL